MRVGKMRVRTADDSWQEPGDRREQGCRRHVNCRLGVQAPVCDGGYDVPFLDRTRLVQGLAMVPCLGDLLVLAREARVLERPVWKPVQAEEPKEEARQCFYEEEPFPDWRRSLEVTDAKGNEASKCSEEESGVGHGRICGLATHPAMAVGPRNQNTRRPSSVLWYQSDK